MSKPKSVEQQYQKKSLLEHVLLRPDTYIGSIEPSTQKMWVYDEKKNRIVYEQITYTPGLYKIFGKFPGR
jgi:DNA topoisomerase-2